ncbi:MAG: alanine dehydrogenase [Myxococcota bacterium]|jgi:alanine dehydrogenase
MLVGVPKEIKVLESRVSLTPGGAAVLCSQGHQVVVEESAGNGSGFNDQQYIAAGATILPSAAEVWAQADMILKVKEPQANEVAMARKGQTIFTYFHLAADRELTESLIKTGAHCFAYETLDVNGTLPLLTPMSEVAGRMAVQEGAKALQAPEGGRGVLLGGLPGVAPAQVTILGGGVVGTQAAYMAAGLGANVTILDLSLDRMRYLEDVMPANVTTVYSTHQAIHHLLPITDLLIGAVLIPGAKAPKLVKREDLAMMQDGAVIVDVAVDQGGCIETCSPTTHANPTFVIDGVVHYCVANMPGAVPRTSTFGLTNATLPYVCKLAKMGAKTALLDDAQLRSAANIIDGKLCYQAVAEAFDLENYSAIDLAKAL